MATKKTPVKTPKVKDAPGKSKLTKEEVQLAIKTVKVSKQAVKEVTKKPVKKSKYPIITVGSHSIRTEHANGKVEFVVDDDKLREDVMKALS